MKKTKLKLDKTTIKLLTPGALANVGGADNLTNTLCASAGISGCPACPTHAACQSNQWTCNTYGCGTTATVGC